MIGAAIEVHRSLGPRLSESVYEECPCYELGLRDLAYPRQVAIPVVYKDLDVPCGYRAHVIVRETVPSSRGGSAFSPHMKHCS